jgi:hypothetical protein
MDAGPIATSSEQRQPSEGEARVRYRATWPQRLATAVPLLFFMPFMYLHLFLWNRSPGFPGPPLWMRVEFWVLPVLIVPSVWMQGWWAGVTLTPQVAAVHRLRRRDIPWTRVAAVEAERFGAGARRVVLYETDGRRTPLRIPSTAFLAWDRQFDAKAAAIRDWWLTHGGADHEPLDSAGSTRAPEPLPDRLCLRPTAVQAVPVAMLITLLAMEATAAGFTGGPGTDHATATSRALGSLAAILLLFTAGQLCLRSGATLTPGHLRIDGLRHRTLAWSEVQTITVEPRRGGRRVVVTDLHGRRTFLAAPRLGFLLWDHDFGLRVGMLHRFWHTHRGADWTPGMTAEQAPGQVLAPYSGPRVWQRVVVGLVCAVLGWMVFLWVLVGGLMLTLG